MRCVRFPAVLLAILAVLATLACRGDGSAVSGSGETASETSADPRSADLHAADLRSADLHSNAQKSDSTAPGAAAASCLLDRGGCAVAANAIKPCGETEDLAPVTLEQISSDPASHDGKTLAVRGALAKSGAGCTERSCEDTCCNACTAMLALGDPRSPDHIRLESTTRPGRYRCIGDESMTCCEIDAKGQEVIARGVFHVVTGLEPAIHQLWTSELCVP